MMVFGIVFAAQIGQSIIPFKQVALTVFSAYETLSGTGIDYARYMLVASLICVGCALFFIVMGKYIFRPDMSKLLALKAEELDKDGALQLDGRQKTILVFLFLLVALLLAPNFLPADFFLTRLLKAIGNTGIVILLVTVMCAIKVDGKALLNFKVMVDSGVTWGIVLLLAFVQPLTIGMAREDSGITAFLMQLIMPLFGGKLADDLCSVHRAGRRAADADYEQRRCGRRPHARHSQLLPGLGHGARPASDYGRHGRAFRFPDARRKRKRPHCSTANEWSNTAVIWKNRSHSHSGGLCGYGARYRYARQPPLLTASSLIIKIMLPFEA